MVGHMNAQVQVVLGVQVGNSFVTNVPIRDTAELCPPISGLPSAETSAQASR